MSFHAGKNTGQYKKKKKIFFVNLVIDNNLKRFKYQSMVPMLIFVLPIVII